MTIGSYLFSVDELHNRDSFITRQNISGNATFCQLDTEYSKDGEVYAWSLNPPANLDSTQLGEIIYKLMPQYPNCPLTEIEEVHRKSKDILYSDCDTSKELGKTQAGAFLFANRLIRLYNREFVKNMHSAIEVLQVKYEQNLSSMKNLDTTALTGPANELKEELQNYLSSIPENSFSPAIKTAIEKMDEIAQACLQCEPIDLLCIGLNSTLSLKA